MEKITPAQRKVLEHLDRTAFYGQNKRTFDALLKQGFIMWRTDHVTGPSGHRFVLTDAGRRTLK